MSTPCYPYQPCYPYKTLGKPHGSRGTRGKPSWKCVWKDPLVLVAAIYQAQVMWQPKWRNLGPQAFSATWDAVHARVAWTPPSVTYGG